MDIGDYCRLVEDHLTRVNAGHLVRIVGPGFELVRQWAEEGIPLSVVFRGVELKAERHRAGNARRPLRIEFCEADVRDVYRGWRRAVGLVATDEPAEGKETRPSLTRHLDRAVERLSQGMGRMDLPGALRDWLETLLQELITLRDTAKKARGASRDDIASRLASLDDELAAVVRQTAAPDVLEAVRREAELELASYRGRLADEAWQKAVGGNTDRLLRDRYGLPAL